MKLKDLPIGSKVKFGSYAKRTNSPALDLKWTKITANGMLVLEPGVLYGTFDAPEQQASNRDRRHHGWNYFPLSNIFQFINSSEAQWFKPQHDADECGYANYSHDCGFLSSFTSEEIAQIIPHEITVGTPDGARKKYGTRTTQKCLISLPSLSQLNMEFADDYLRCEGGEIPALRDDSVFRGWTRSGAAGTHRVYSKWYRDSIRTGFCNDRECICPMLILNPEIDVPDLPDENGFYHVQIAPANSDHIMSDDFITMLFS